MRIIVDECLAESTKKILTEKKFEILEIDRILRTSASDEEIVNYASKHSLSIITHDRGFGEIYHKTTEKSPMIIILQNLSPHPEFANELLLKELGEDRPFREEISRETNYLYFNCNQN